MTGPKARTKTFEDSLEVSEVSPFPILKCDAKGQLLFMNKAFQQLLDLTSVPHDHFNNIMPNAYVSILEHVLTTRQAHTARKRFGGRTFDLIFEPSKQPSEVFIFINDLTTQEEVKTQLIRTEKMASLGMLVAGLAHEINTPMGSIHSNNDVLSRAIRKMRRLTSGTVPLEARQGREFNQMLGILEKVCGTNSIACERIIHIVRSLKDFARLDEAKRKRASVVEALESALALVQHQF